MQATGRFANRNGISRKRTVITLKVQGRRPLQRATEEGMSPVIVMLMPFFAILIFLIWILFETP